MIQTDNLIAATLGFSTLFFALVGVVTTFNYTLDTLTAKLRQLRHKRKIRRMRAERRQRYALAQQQRFADDYHKQMADIAAWQKFVERENRALETERAA